MSFNMKQLRYALAAASPGSFQRAARSLVIEKSSLSRQVRNLEDSLGAPLFYRSRAGVRPTLAGQRFLRGGNLPGEALLAGQSPRLAVQNTTPCIST